MGIYRLTAPPSVPEGWRIIFFYAMDEQTLRMEVGQWVLDREIEKYANPPQTLRSRIGRFLRINLSTKD